MPDAQFFHVDVSLPQRYFYDRQLFPLVHCEADLTAEGVKWQALPILPEERILGYKSFPGTCVDVILNSGYPKLCCGIRFYYPKQVGLMMKDVPNHFYHYPERTFVVWEGMKTQEHKRTPNKYDWLTDRSQPWQTATGVLSYMTRQLASYVEPDNIQLCVKSETKWASTAGLQRESSKWIRE